MYLAAEDKRSVSRRLRVLRGLSSTGGLAGPFHDRFPPCSYSLTPLDWRVLSALIASPEASPTRLARLVGVTLKTFIGHRARLIERHAVFFLPKVDWSKLDCVSLVVTCRDAEYVDPIRAELQSRYPASIPMDVKGGEGIAPGWDDSTCFAEMVPAHSPHAVHSLVREISRFPGVKFVRFETWGPERLYFHWIQNRVAERIAATAPTTSRLVAGAGVRRRLAPAAAKPAGDHGVTAH